MQKHRATKINISPEAVYAAAQSVEEYWHGDNDLAPPIDYYVEGVALAAPKVGESFMMLRDNRNGIRVTGIFTTSKVVKIDELSDCLILTTNNSVYKLEKIQHV